MGLLAFQVSEVILASVFRAFKERTVNKVGT